MMFARCAPPQPAEDVFAFAERVHGLSSFRVSYVDRHHQYEAHATDYEGRVVDVDWYEVVDAYCKEYPHMANPVSTIFPKCANPR